MMQIFSIVMSILIHIDETISLRLEQRDKAILFQRCCFVLHAPGGSRGSNKID